MSVQFRLRKGASNWSFLHSLSLDNKPFQTGCLNFGFVHFGIIYRVEVLVTFSLQCEIVTSSLRLKKKKELIRSISNINSFCLRIALIYTLISNFELIDRHILNHSSHFNRKRIWILIREHTVALFLRNSAVQSLETFENISLVTEQIEGRVLSVVN